MIVVYTYRERFNMHSQRIAFNTSVCMGLASAEGKKLKCFK
jgi:hypothetical protein